MRRNTVRGRNGVIREVNDDYVLLDGEALVVELSFMDTKGFIVHDGHGNPAGQRPGFLYSDANEQVERARADAYAEYNRTIQERWRGQRSSPTPSDKAVFNSPEAALAAAYAEYDKTIQERWRK